MLRRQRSLFITPIVLLAVACGGTSTTPPPTTGTHASPAGAAGRDGAEQAPLGRLPRDVVPSHYQLSLTILPDQERFSGSVSIRVSLETERRVIWLHGRDMNVDAATVTPEGGSPIAAEWEQVDEEGVVALRLAEPVGPGEATIDIAYDAAFGRDLRGLYRVDTGGSSYAFTQFEAISARLAFPGFDEPSFKTPFDVSLTVRRDHVAAGNTLVVEEQELPDGLKQVRYATTEKLPTYLMAWAVGPLEVVEAEPIPPNAIRARPIPFRGIAVRGQGDKLRYALRETPAMLEELEAWFGTEYPYDKLDVVAVPDFGAGAMENVGLITFREWLLLVDEDQASEDQKRAFAHVMAHELAHQWFGNLVTMPWWNDLWLNEAFATWMGNKTIRARYPSYHAGVSMLGSVHRAMRADSLSTARRIRQPIETPHDIRNAFDSITYSKGGGVLEMFERWIGPDEFQQGIRLHMDRHRHGTATAEDLLASLTEASGRDVSTPFMTFLTQPGVPFLDADVLCHGGDARLSLRQSRFLPVGSPARRESIWQVPVCARYETGGEIRQSCALLSGGEGTLELEGDSCPSWVMPNSDGAGYFRFSLPASELDKLRSRRVWDELSARERLAVADSLNASFDSAATSAGDLLSALGSLATDDIRPVATTPMGILGFAHEQLVDEGGRAKVESYGRQLYQRAFRRLGFAPRRGRLEDGETSLLRERIVEFLAMRAHDPNVRREAARLGRRYIGFGGDGALHPEAVDPSVAGTALSVAVQEGDAELFDALTVMLFASEDATVRSRILAALGHTTDPELASRARSLSLDARLRTNEVASTLWAQMDSRETRAATWEWLQANFDALVHRVSVGRAGWLPWMTAGFCAESRADEVQAFFEPRIDSLPGGPRNLAGALEAIRLCAARAEAHRQSAREFFNGRN